MGSTGNIAGLFMEIYIFFMINQSFINDGSSTIYNVANYGQLLPTALTKINWLSRDYTLGIKIFVQNDEKGLYEFIEGKKNHIKKIKKN